jgi:hypothetical protein
MIHEAARRAARSAKIFKGNPRVIYTVNKLQILYTYYMYESAVRRLKAESISRTCVIILTGT